VIIKTQLLLLQFPATDMNRYAFISTLVLILTHLLFPDPIYGQTSSLSIWPPILETTIKPGKSMTQIFTLKNLGDTTTITASIVPFDPSGQYGHVRLSNTPTPGQSYFSLQNTDLGLPDGKTNLPVTFPLKAGDTQDLLLTINPPESSPEADHYFSFLFNSSNLGLIPHTGTRTLGSIASNILLTVSQTNQLSHMAKIENLSASPCFPSLPFCLIDSFSKPQFNLTVSNTGSTRFKAIAHIDIKNTFNQSTATISFYKDNILKNSSRQLVPDSTWKSVLPLGRYQLTAVVTPQNSTNTITQTSYIYIFPYKALLILIILLVLKRRHPPPITS